MKRVLFTVLFQFLVMSSALAGLADLSTVPFVHTDVTIETNIHFNERYCIECHRQRPQIGDDIQLRFENYTQTCRCHGYTPETYTHLVETELSVEKRSKIPAEFPLTDDRITCSTCHNMALQCRPQYEFRRRNKPFLRVDPGLGRTFLCFQCHEEKKYKMFDPHKQLDEVGGINEESCLYCHEVRPDEYKVTLDPKQNGGESVRLVGNFEVLCQRCHNDKAGLHPLNKNHLVRPSDKVRSRMYWSERNLWIVLPLNDEGKITCITCHNPHERGVIPEEKAASAGASEKGRLRKSWGGGSICVACHNM
ncbi:MAG: hypothetical protein WBB19_11820 [Desulforhopalus sp.]